MGSKAVLGFSKAMTEGWVKIDKNNKNGPTVVKNVMNTIYIRII